MPIELTCPNCTSLLRVPDAANGRLVRCPKCHDPVRVGDAEVEPADNVFERITERPATRTRGTREATDKMDAPARREKLHEDEVLEESPDEVFEDIEIVEEPAPKRRKKRRKKKRLRPVPSDAEEERETPAWIWWVAGGCGIAFTFATMLMIAIVTDSESALKFHAIILLVILPISWVVFFAAMILANLLVGAVEFGELHVAIVKSFGLVLAVNLINLVPYAGVYILAPIVWISGLMLLFRLDM